MSDRGENSRNKIKETLEHLVESTEESSKGKLGFTASGLMTEANVSRGTFYAYYNNLEDALEDLAMDYSRKILELMRRGRKEVPGMDGYGQAYRHILQLIYEHPKLFRAVVSRKKLEQKFLLALQEFLYQQYTVEFPDQNADVLRYTAISNIYFIYGMALEWGRDGFTKTPAEMANLFTSALKLTKQIDGLY